MRKHWKKIALVITLLILIILAVVACSSGIGRIDLPAEATLPTGETTVPVETTLPAEETTAPSEPEEEIIPPTTEIPIAEPPATEPAASKPSATEPPAIKEPEKTEPDVTEPSATESPKTEPPSTDPPSTDPPVKEPTSTVPPVTEPVPTNPIGCQHDWKCISHAEVGHWRAGIVCDCGWTVYGDPDKLTALWNAHSASFPPAESLFEHGGFGSIDEWIVDTPAYNEWICSKCGAVSATQP